MTPAKAYDLLKLEGPRPPDEPDPNPPTTASGEMILKHVNEPNSETIEHYLGRGGYEMARKAVTQMKPEEVTKVVQDSGLRGRGGAGFATGLKWTFVPKGSPKPKYLVCNADESEPATFKDRIILEKDPHQVIEGMILAAYAIGANTAYIYIRGEFGKGYRVFQKALEEAYARGFLGRNIFGSPYSLDITIHRGAGAYICGEETALLSSIEGKRGYPKIKPPFPAVEGLFGCPTIINNVETLATVPHILRNGPQWFRQFGNEKSPGLKIFGISGHVKRPGLYELPLGTPLRKIIYDAAGGIRNGKKLKAVIPGGSSAGVLTADEIDLPMDFESLAAKGQILGTAGIIVMDEDTCMVRALWNVLRFYHHESCGQCTPCREGTGWLEKMVARIERGGGRPEDLDLMVETGNNMCGRTICVLADAAAYPTKHFISRFRGEFEEHMKRGGCPFRRDGVAEPSRV